MSGFTKRILYHILDTFLLLATLAGVFLLLIFTTPDRTAGEFIAGGAVVLCILLRIPALVHEVGHILFGALSGMRVQSVVLSLVRFTRGSKIELVGYSEAAGDAQLYPTNGKNMRAKLVVSALGGSAVNLMIGGIFLALYFVKTYSAVLLFAAMFGLFSLYEGLRALIPAELPAGMTDGKFVLGLIRKRPEEEVILRVAQAQGILYRGSFSNFPRKVLIDTPVVREDLPAYRALLLLRVQYLLAKGDKKGAQTQIDRLFALSEYFTAEEQAEAERYLAYIGGKPFVAGEASMFHGITELERILAARKT